ncbi:MAG: hypothetical protein AAB403_16140 [Planctomycetota bacterium]
MGQDLWRRWRTSSARSIYGRSCGDGHGAAMKEALPRPLGLGSKPKSVTIGGMIRRLFRVVAGLLVLSGGYTWTVGQSGLAATNQNLCELVNSFVPFSLEGCQVQYWIAGLWCVLWSVAAIFLSVEGFRWILRIERREVRLRMLWLLAAIFVIGLAVTLFLLIRQGQQPVAAVQRPEDAKEISRLTDSLAEERAKVRRLPADTSNAPSFKPAATLTTHDREDRQKFTGKALDLLGNQLAPVLVQAAQVVAMPNEPSFRTADPSKSQELIRQHMEKKRDLTRAIAAALEEQFSAIKTLRGDATLPLDISTLIKPPDQNIPERLRLFGRSLNTLMQMSEKGINMRNFDDLTKDSRDILYAEISSLKQWNDSRVGTLQQMKADLSK